jgi:redox-sensitive bicupin YhaK (pirin superfamily)
VHQHVDLYASVLQEGEALEMGIAAANKLFVQVVSGEITVNGQVITGGDGAQITNERELRISSQSEAEFLVFDMG